ncbi:MAG: tetratricopeptide repeat protein [Chloroflexi bacterium]|nr:tetratricopeptide repeat protein [Chloroflexota bacterium]
MTMNERRQPEGVSGQVPDHVPTDAELDAWPVPESAQGYFRRGIRFAQLGFPDRAIKDFEEAAAREPANAEIQYNLGTAHLALGMFEQALRNFDLAIALMPGSSDTYGNRAVAFAALGEPVQSKRDVEQAVRFGADRARLEGIVRFVMARRNMGHGLLETHADGTRDHGHELPHPRWGGFGRTEPPAGT